MNNISNKLVDLFIKNSIIEEKDKEIYHYGITQGFVMILNFITIIIIGLIFKMLLESLLLIITYIPIRIYGGGYHCRTPKGCYIFSIIMQIVILLLINLTILKSGIAILIISITSGIIGVLLSPVEDLNKILDELEIKVYRRKSIINIAIMQILTVILLLLRFNQYALVVSLAIGSSAFMMVLGKLYNISYSKKISKQS